MKVIKNPDISRWQMLCQRPAIENKNLMPIVTDIIQYVKENGDKALIEYAEKFDKTRLNTIQVTQTEIDEAKHLVGDELKKAILKAKQNIEVFHQSQTSEIQKININEGIIGWRKSVPIERVGFYIPGGSAPLFSTILMLAVPAKIAGCEEIILCTPPNHEGKINPVILWLLDNLGITKIFKVGGAQAIAAMTFGTETVPKVYKIFGPGNQFVTQAKLMVQQEGMAIDMPAGPSEVLVIADDSANPEFVASDLLSQAEHGIDSQTILLSNSLEFIDKTINYIESQIEQLPRKDMAAHAIKNSLFIYFEDLNKAMHFSNKYAPEHLILATQINDDLIDKIKNAGSVFLGNYSCESLGDYASGTNHTLPTNGYAKNFSGVSVDSFVKKITFQEVTKQGILNIGKEVELMAEAEGLMAHKNAVTLRLKSISS